MNNLREFIIRPEDKDRLRNFFSMIGNKNDQPYAYHYSYRPGKTGPAYLKYKTTISDEDYATLKLMFETFDAYPL